MRRALLLIVCTLAACAEPVAVEATHALVRRSGASVDTVRVGRADSLRVEVEMRLLDGRAAWTLAAPDGAEVWGGAVVADSAQRGDTLAVFAVAAPDAGDWRVRVAPDSAIGAVWVRARAE